MLLVVGAMIKVAGIILIKIIVMLNQDVFGIHMKVDGVKSKAAGIGRVRKQIVQM